METPVSKSIKIWTNKNGEVKTKEYNQQKYSQKHYANHQDKYKNKIMCGCGIEYTPPNKSNHQHSRIHKLYQSYSNIASE
jgi:hypothetical protein